MSVIPVDIVNVPCRLCLGVEDGDHVDGRCLFAPTVYTPFSGELLDEFTESILLAALGTNWEKLFLLDSITVMYDVKFNEISYWLATISYYSRDDTFPNRCSKMRYIRKERWRNL